MTNPGLWLALCALTFSPWTLDSFELPHQLVLAVGALVSASVGLARARAVQLGVAAVLALAALTTLTSSAPLLSLPALVTLGVLAAFATTGARVDLRPVLWTTWPIALWAVLQATGHDFMSWADSAHWCGGVRPFATLGHPTQLGVWMALVAVIALEHSRQSRAWLATALLAAMVCVLSLSRAGWLALAVGVATWAWLRRGAALKPWHFAVGALALLAPAVLLGPAALIERLTHFFTAPTRVHLWTTAWQGFVRHPLLGWGLDTFTLVDQEFRHPEAWRYEWGATAGHAHSFVPQVLATQGVVGALTLAVVAVLVLRRWWRTPAERRDVAAIAVVVALAAASMVAFSGVPVAALGLCALVASLDGEAPETGRAALPLALIGLLMTALSFSASAAARVGLTREGEVEHATRWLTRARQLEPWNATWPTRLGAVLEWEARRSSAAELERQAQRSSAVREAELERQAQRSSAMRESSAVLDAAELERQAQRSSAVREAAELEWQARRSAVRAAYEAGAALAPGVAVFEANVGRAASEAHDVEGTRAWFERARRHAPLDARIALEAAEAAMRVGDLALADATLTSTLALYPTDGPAWLSLASLRLQQRRPLEARAALEAGLAADWRDWPEGHALTRAALAEFLARSGDIELANRVAQSPAGYTAPAEVCGAPALLAR